MMTKPKIIIFINSLSSGGAERVVSHLLWNLKDDFEIHLAVYCKIIDFEIPSEVKIFDLKQSITANDFIVFLKIPLLAHKIHRYCKKNNIHTSVAFLNRPCYINAVMRYLFGFKGRIVMCQRTHQTSLLSIKSQLYRAISKTLVRFAYKRADLVLANSYVMKADLVDNFKITTPIRVIHNPINLGHIKKMSDMPVLFSFSKDIFYFVSVGGFRKEKNIALMIEAFFRLRHLPVQLLLIGAGTQELYLKEKTSALNLDAKITFIGFDSNPYKYVKKCDCFVLSSFVEGFPNVLLEALALEKPVISTDCKSGPREILAPGTDIHYETTTNIEIAEYGVLTPPNDVVMLAAAMIKMYEDKALREQYISRGLNKAREFDVEEIKQFFHVAFSH